MEEPHPCTHPSFFPPSFLPLHFPSFFFFPLFNCPSLPLAFSFLSLGFSFFHSFRVSHFPSLSNLVDLVLELDCPQCSDPVLERIRLRRDRCSTSRKLDRLGSARFLLLFCSYWSFWGSDGSDPGGETNSLVLLEGNRAGSETKDGEFDCWCCWCCCCRHFSCICQLMWSLINIEVETLTIHN